MIVYTQSMLRAIGIFIFDISHSPTSKRCDFRLGGNMFCIRVRCSYWHRPDARVTGDGDVKRISSFVKEINWGTVGTSGRSVSIELKHFTTATRNFQFQPCAAHVDRAWLCAYVLSVNLLTRHFQFQLLSAVNRTTIKKKSLDWFLHSGERIQAIWSYYWFLLVLDLLTRPLSLSLCYMCTVHTTFDYQTSIDDTFYHPHTTPGWQWIDKLCSFALCTALSTIANTPIDILIRVGRTHTPGPHTNTKYTYKSHKLTQEDLQ